MAVPLENRCAVRRCRLTSKYTLWLTLAPPDGPLPHSALREWKVCLKHRDSFEALLQGAMAGENSQNP